MKLSKQIKVANTALVLSALLALGGWTAVSIGVVENFFLRLPNINERYLSDEQLQRNQNIIESNTRLARTGGKALLLSTPVILGSIIAKGALKEQRDR